MQCSNRRPSCCKVVSTREEKPQEEGRRPEYHDNDDDQRDSCEAGFWPPNDKNAAVEEDETKFYEAHGEDLHEEECPFQLTPPSALEESDGT